MPDKDIKKDKGDFDYQGASDDQKKIIDSIKDDEDEGSDSAEKNNKEKPKDKGKKSEAKSDEDEDDDDLSNLDEEVDKHLSDKKPAKKKDDDEDEDDDDDDADDDDDEDGEDDDDDDGKDKGRKPTSVPMWKHLKTVRKLKVDLKAAQSLAADKSGGNEEVDEALQKEIDNIAEESGIDPKAIAKIVAIAKKAGNATLIPKLQELESLAKESQELKEDSEFDKEFGPLTEAIVKEHGDNAVAKIKKALHTLAFTTQYAQVPLEVIYTGLKMFRGKKGQGRSTVQSGTPGGGKRGDGKIDFSKVTDDDIDTMSNDEFEEYSKYLKSQDKKTR